LGGRQRKEELLKKRRGEEKGRSKWEEDKEKKNYCRRGKERGREGRSC